MNYSKSPFNTTFCAFGHASRRSPSILGGFTRDKPLRCEYIQHPNGSNRCRMTDDGEHDLRCEVNEKTSRCNLAKSRTKHKPSVAPIEDAHVLPSLISPIAVKKSTVPPDTKSPSRCVKQTTAKYTSPSRKSPPYPANQCRGQTMKGNDGNMYHSTPNVRDVCTWKKVAN